MVIATRGAGSGSRAGIRFGIRWDDGRRPKRALLPLVAISAVLATAAGTADARPMPLAPAPVSGAVDLGGLGRPGALVHGPDFSSEGFDRELAGLDTFGHGTHLAGLISGDDPLSGFQGVAPGRRWSGMKWAGMKWNGLGSAWYDAPR